MSPPDRAVPRNPWPIIRFFAHSRPWASSQRRLALGEKSKSATLRAKECERNRTDCRCRFGICIASCRRSSVLNSFNRGAADLDGFAIANEARQERPWKRVAKTSSNRPHCLDGRQVCSVPFASVDFSAFRSKRHNKRRSRH